MEKSLKKPNHSSNNELWLISYADLMTLLFGFFFLLYVSQEEGFQKISTSLAKEFESKSKDSPKASNPKPTNDTSAAAAAEDNKITSPSASGEITKARLFLFPCRMCITWKQVSVNSTIGEVFKTKALLVEHIVPGGPADIAGIQELDKVTHVNDVEADLQSIRSMFNKLDPNTTIKVDLQRDGVAKTLVVQLDKFADPGMEIDSVVNGDENLFMEIYGRKLNDVDRIKAYIPRDVTGWVVTRPDPINAGIKVGDIIVGFKKMTNSGYSNAYMVKMYDLRDYNWQRYPQPK